jgi:DNA-binding transcriptional LysR family regulator
MEIRHLRSFVTVAIAGSITRASKQLSLAQPAVSQHIHALEVELGVLLFDRTSRGVTLTEAGMALLGPARSLLAAERDARASVQQIGLETRAEVEIASIPNAAGTLLPRAALLLRDQATPFRLRVYEQASDGCLRLLLARMVELAIVRDLPPGSGFLTDVLVREDLVLAVPASHALAQPQANLAMFKNENFVMFDFRHGIGLHRMAMEACAQAGFVPRILCEGPEAGTIGKLIALGLGVAIVPRSAVHLWDSSAISIVRLENPIPQSVISIARLPGEPLSDRAQRVARAVARVAAGLTGEGDSESRLVAS